MLMVMNSGYPSQQHKLPPVVTGIWNCEHVVLLCVGDVFSYCAINSCVLHCSILNLWWMNHYSNILQADFDALVAIHCNFTC